MPVSETAQDIASRPVSVAIKQALDNIENGKAKKEEIIKEIVEKLSNLNMMETLMEVHQGTKSKDKVFTDMKSEFNTEFNRLAEQDQLINASNQVISSSIGDF